jgi:hypothetical protein
MSEQLQASSRIRSHKLSLAWQQPLLPVLTLLTAVGLLLLSQFRLGAWAEASEFHHTIQHVLIFSAGVGFGGSAKSLYHRRSSDKMNG